VALTLSCCIAVALGRRSCLGTKFVGCVNIARCCEHCTLLSMQRSLLCTDGIKWGREFRMHSAPAAGTPGSCRKVGTYCVGFVAPRLCDAGRVGCCGVLGLYAVLCVLWLSRSCTVSGVLHLHWTQLTVWATAALGMQPALMFVRTRSLSA
jgi:hypothetical protein